MSRLILIGDIHGCFDELSDLLARLRVRADDVVVALGDLVRKGPAAHAVVTAWRSANRPAVLGNNDAKLVKRSRSLLRRLMTRGDEGRLMRDRASIDWLARLPLFLEFPEHAVVAVHGGVLPNDTTFGAHLVTRDAALELRYVRRGGNGWMQIPKGGQQPGDPFWSEVWDGDRTIVYGHTPVREPRIDNKAIGIDTGCVYGGHLTAAVFERGRWSLEQVRARRAYVER